MRQLETFAFLHPMSQQQLRPFRESLPAVEFLVTDNGMLPAGLERAQAAAIGWDFRAVDALLDVAGKLRWLHLRGTGVDRIATPALVKSDIVLTNGSGNHAPNIAEHVLAMMLAFARQLPFLIRAQGKRHWSMPPAERIFELSGQTLLIVGLGAIGRELAGRATALGMHVTGVRRTKIDMNVKGIEHVEGMDGLDRVLPLADHVAIALPLTSETRGLFSATRLGLCKPGAYVYNVGRGPLIDQTALLHALMSGAIAGAGLDVTDPEPLPSASPLWDHPHVMLTAHSAGLTPRSYERYQDLLLSNMQRFGNGESLHNIVDKQRGY